MDLLHHCDLDLSTGFIPYHSLDWKEIRIFFNDELKYDFHFIKNVLNEIIAYAVVSLNKDGTSINGDAHVNIYHYLEAFEVHPNFRNKHIGSKLLEYVKQYHNNEPMITLSIEKSSLFYYINGWDFITDEIYEDAIMVNIQSDRRVICLTPREHRVLCDIEKNYQRKICKKCKGLIDIENECLCLDEDL